MYDCEVKSSLIGFVWPWPHFIDNWKVYEKHFSLCTLVLLSIGAITLNRLKFSVCSFLFHICEFSYCSLYPEFRFKVGIIQNIKDNFIYDYIVCFLRCYFRNTILVIIIKMKSMKSDVLGWDVLITYSNSCYLYVV